MSTSVQTADSTNVIRTTTLACLRIRTTIFFIGIILLLFGTALLMTFAQSFEKGGIEICNGAEAIIIQSRKFHTSMRLAGGLLLGTAALTLLCATLLCFISGRRTHRERQTRSTQNSRPQGQEASHNGLRYLLLKLRRNWQRQSQAATQSVVSQREQSPPEYYSLEEQDCNNPGVFSLSSPPPPYDVTV